MSWLAPSPGHQLLTKGFLQRVEPGFEVTPLLEALLENGTPHLLGAGCPHTASGLPEFQALWLEFEAAMLEDAPHVAFEVIDERLVLDAQDLAGQHHVPVSHQAHVGLVVAADVIEAVGELLPAGEELFEIAEAAGHRLTARIDDRRVWQNEMQQPDVPEVVRH